MPSALTYPGVYIEEVPSGVRSITGVATSITAFVGRARRGPINDAVRVQSFAEFGRLFGGLWQPSTLSYAVSQFFQHGGADALIVRVFNGNVADSTATLTLPTTGGTMVLEAASPGGPGMGRCHSARKAITGSILIARRAGKNDAHSVMSSNVTDSAM